MKMIFWNVDTQHDFMEPNGALYVQDAEEIRGVLSQLTKLAADKHITVVNTADWHIDDSAEISITPDMKETFPEHCLKDTLGAEYIRETRPENPVAVDWQDNSVNWDDLLLSREILIYKDKFDVFSGNRWADEIVQRLAPDLVVVYGVATNYCVNLAVLGLADRVRQVMVVEDAVKHLPLPGEPQLTFDRWREKGVLIRQLSELKSLLEGDLGDN